MGQIFSPKELYNRHVPDVASFERVASYARERIAEERSILFAAIFGSTMSGANRRSDVDLVVVYDANRMKRAMAALRAVDLFAREDYVPMDFAVCDSEMARTRFHPFGPSLRLHLGSAIRAGGLIKGSLDILASTVSIETEIETYISRKAPRLLSAMARRDTLESSEYLRLLKKAFEAPTHVARKMLVYQGVRDCDSKQEVHERYIETMPLNLTVDLEFLIKRNRDYDAELERQRGYCNLQRYGEFLAQLERDLPVVIEFLLGNVLWLHKAR